MAHPPCFCLVFSPTYSSLCLLLFGKLLLLSCVTGHNQAKHISLKARRTTLMIKLGLERREEPKCSSLCVSVSPRECHGCPRPLLASPCPSSTHYAPPCIHSATSSLSCSFISCNMMNISLRYPVFSSSAQASPLVEFACHCDIPLLTSPDKTCCSNSPLSPPADLKPNINLFL